MADYLEEIKRGLITAKNTIVATKSAVEGDSVTACDIKAVKEKAYHQKKGVDIWRVRLQGGRTDRETFVELKAATKSYGGYYSFYKGGGDKPGFVFEEEAQAQDFLGDFQRIMSPGDGNSSLTDKAGTGVDRDIVENVANKFLGGLNFTQKIELNVYESAEELTRRVNVDPKQAKRALGYLQGNKLHLTAGTMQAASEIQPLLRYEILEHYGLDVLEKTDKPAILKRNGSNT